MKIAPRIISHLFCGIICTGTILVAVSRGTAQNLFVANFGSGDIYEFANDDGTLSSTPTVFASGFNQPSGLAFNDLGDLFVANFGSGNIVEITPDRGQSLFADGLNQPALIAFNSVGDLFVADSGSGNIVKITPNGVQSTVVSGVNAYALTFDGGDNLFVANFGNGNIYEFTNNSGTLNSNATLFASGFYQPTSLAFDSKSNLFVGEANNIIEITPTGATNFIASTSYPGALAFDKGGNLFFTTQDHYIVEITPDGVQGIFSSSLNGGQGLVFQTPSTPPPFLNIASVGNQVSVFWTAGTNYVLQVTANLNNPNWTDVTNTPVLYLTNLQEQVVLSPTNSSGFYRLKTP